MIKENVRKSKERSKTPTYISDLKNQIAFSKNLLVFAQVLMVLALAFTVVEIVLMFTMKMVLPFVILLVLQMGILGLSNYLRLLSKKNIVRLESKSLVFSDYLIDSVSSEVIEGNVTNYESKYSFKMNNDIFLHKAEFNTGNKKFNIYVTPEQYRNIKNKNHVKLEVSTNCKVVKTIL